MFYQNNVLTLNKKYIYNEYKYTELNTLKVSSHTYLNILKENTQ